MQANELIQLTQGFRIGSADSDRIGFNLNPIRSLTKKKPKGRQIRVKGNVRNSNRETLETTLEFLTFPKEKNNKKINPPSPFLPLKSGFVSKPAVLSWDRDGQSGTGSICRSFLIRLTNIDNLFFFFFQFLQLQETAQAEAKSAQAAQTQAEAAKDEALKAQAEAEQAKTNAETAQAEAGA